MSKSVLDRINRRLQLLETTVAVNYRDPHSPGYDRQEAEDALYHTIGPLTENPRWSNSWTSQTPPPPDFSPGGPAPRWTQEEVAVAYAGDPSLLFKAGGMDHPKSPSYGPMGGSPLYRLAKKVSRIYNRGSDKSFIEDMYGNGFIELMKQMQPGVDESRSPFISFVTRNVQSAMEHGVGGTEQGIRAAGGDSKSGLVGLKSVLSSDDPHRIREIADQVKGKYQTTRSNDKHPDNPFGRFSSTFYRVVMNYADAIESGDPNRVESARSQIDQLSDEIDDSAIFIPGASTGMGQAVSTSDRKSHVGVSSIDAETSNSEGAASSMAGNLPDTSTLDDPDDNVDNESLQYVLNLALNYDIGELVGRIPAFQKLLDELGGKSIGGKMTANELRYLIRSLGRAGAKYPGVGVPRANVNIPRDGKGWWAAGEDPEIEPLPGGGGHWNSIWKRNGYNALGPTEIAAEMTEEVREFNKLGIPTVREIKKKNKSTGKAGVKADVEEVVSKVAVGNTTKAAMIKMKILAMMHREELGTDSDIYADDPRGRRAAKGPVAPTTTGMGGPEMAESRGRYGIPILEGLDRTDRLIIAETCDKIVRHLRRFTVRAFYEGIVAESRNK